MPTEHDCLKKVTLQKENNYLHMTESIHFPMNRMLGYPGICLLKIYDLKISTAFVNTETYIPWPAKLKHETISQPRQTNFHNVS